MNSKLYVGSLNFTVEHPSAKAATSDALRVFDGIRIYPLRYGVYRKENNDNLMNFCINSGDSALKLTRKGDLYPDLDSYGYFYPMPLREGWLYVYSNKLNGVLEYQYYNGFILHDFYQASTDGKEKKDIKSLFSTHKEYILVHKDDKLHFLYTPIRLDKKLIDERFIRNTPKALLDCKKWCDSDGISLSKIEERRLDTSKATVFYPKNLFQYDAPFIERYNAVLEKAHQDNLGKTKNKDLIFVIDDALGIAEQISYDLNENHIRLVNLVKSIQTGKPPQEAEDGEKEKYPDYRETQAGLIHLFSTYMYKLVYNESNPKDITIAERSIEKERLSKILAIEEREKIRNVIQSHRVFLNEVLTSEVFQNFCRFVNIEKETLGDDVGDFYDFHLAILQHITRFYHFLSIPANAADSYIDIQKDKESPHKETDAHIEKTLKAFGHAENEAGKLLGFEMDFDKWIKNPEDMAEAEDKAQRFLLLSDTVLNTLWRIFLEPQETFLDLKVLQKGQSNGVFYKDVLKADAEKMLTELKRKRHVNISSGGAGRWRIVVNSKGELAENGIKISTVRLKPSRSMNLLKSIMQNPIYLSIIGVLYLSNIENAVKDLKRDGVTGGLQILDILLGFAMLQRRYVEKSMELRAASSFIGIDKKSAIAGVSRQMRIMGAVGFFIGSFQSFILAKKRLNDNDTDAAVAYAAAGLASVASGGLILGLKSAAAAGWVGIAGAIVVAGLIWIGRHLTNRDLEKFIQRTILNEDIDYPIEGKENWHIVNELSGYVWRQRFARRDTYMADYKYQIEELIYRFMLLPTFTLDVRYEQEYYFNSRSQVSAFHCTVKCENLFQLPMNFSEVEIVNMYYIKEKWLGGNRITPLFAQPNPELDALLRKFGKTLNLYEKPDPLTVYDKQGSELPAYNMVNHMQRDISNGVFTYNYSK